MRRKYSDCNLHNGNCTECARAVNGVDCHGRAISKLEWARLAAGMSQQQLSAASGVNVRQIQRVEYGESEPGNLAVRTIFALADALDVDPRNLF